MLIVACASVASTLISPLRCVGNAGGSYCTGTVEPWEQWALMLGPPLATIGFGIASVRGGRFTPIAAGAAGMFVVGVAAPLIVGN
jgi:hypothetical protein